MRVFAAPQAQCKHLDALSQAILRLRRRCGLIAAMAVSEARA